MHNVQKIFFVVFGCVGSMQGALPPVITHPSQINFLVEGLEYAPAGNQAMDQIVKNFISARRENNIRDQQIALGQLADTVNRGHADQVTLAILASAFEHGNGVRTPNIKLANFLMNFVGAQAYRNAKAKGILFGPRAQDASTQTDDGESVEADRATQIADLRAALVKQLPKQPVHITLPPVAMPFQEASAAPVEKKKKRKKAASSPLASPAAKAAAAAKRAQRKSQAVQIPVHVAAPVVPAVAEPAAVVVEQPVVAVAPKAPKRSYLQVAKNAVRGAFGMSLPAAAKEVVPSAQILNNPKPAKNNNKPRGGRRAHKADQSKLPPATKALKATAAPAIAASNSFAALPVEETPARMAGPQSAAAVERISAASSVADASEGRSASGASVNSAAAIVDALRRKDKPALYQLLQDNLAVLAGDFSSAEKKEAFARLCAMFCNSDVRHLMRARVAEYVATGNDNGMFAELNGIAINPDAAYQMVQKGLEFSGLSNEERGALEYVGAQAALLQDREADCYKHLQEALKYGCVRAQDDLLSRAMHLSSKGEYAQAHQLFEQLEKAGVKFPSDAQVRYVHCKTHRDELKEKAAAVRKGRRSGKGASEEIVVMGADGTVISGLPQFAGLVQGVIRSAEDNAKELKALESKWDKAQKFMSRQDLSNDMLLRLYEQNMPDLRRIIALKELHELFCTPEKSVLKGHGERRVTLLAERRAQLTSPLEIHQNDIDMFQAYIDAEDLAAARALLPKVLMSAQDLMLPENKPLYDEFNKLLVQDPNRIQNLVLCKTNLISALLEMAARVSPGAAQEIEEFIKGVRSADLTIMGMAEEVLPNGDRQITLPNGKTFTGPAHNREKLIEQGMNAIIAWQNEERANGAASGSSAND